MGFSDNLSHDRQHIYRRNLALYTGSAVAALIAATIGIGGTQHSKKHSQKPVPKAQTAPAPKHHVKEGQAYVALTAFSKRFNLKHEADIAMNSCVAWSDTGGGVAVTYNPGVVSLHADHSFLRYLVFGTKVEKVGQTDRLVVANGPLAITTDGKTYDQTKQNYVLEIDSGGVSGGIWSRASERLVSIAPVEGSYYTDLDTGQPVIRTELISGPLDIQNVGPVCIDLGNGLGPAGVVAP